MCSTLILEVVVYKTLVLRFTFVECHDLIKPCVCWKTFEFVLLFFFDASV